MCIRIRPKYAPFFTPYSKSYTNHVGPKEVEGFNCCMFCWPSPVLGPSTNGTKREKPMEKPNGASTIQNQHAPPESQWFQGRQFRVALCIYRITCTCCGYIYIWMVGWWNVTVHKMGIRMKQPAFHGMTSWHLQIKKGTFPTKKPTRDTPTFSPLVPGSPPTLKRVTTPWSAEPQEFCPQLGCPFLGQLD